jgi:flagellar biogenesis protein FliO
VKAFRIIVICLVVACPLTASNPSTPDSSKPPAPAGISQLVQTPSPTPEAPMDDMRFPFLRAIGGLGLVLSLIVAGYFAAKKLAPQYFSKRSLDKSMKVIETLSMGDKRSISLIQVANSRYLVGNTAHQINLLTALPEQFSLLSEPEAPTAELKNETAKETKKRFRNFLEVEKSRPVPPAGHPLPDDLRMKMRQLREALERG